MTERVRGAGPPVINYAPAVLDDIREYVTAGFNRVADGGVETGGVLFGKRDGRVIAVTAIRAAALSQSGGPAFVVEGDEDVAEFERTIALHRTDAALAGTEPVGWFLSHARDSLVLRPADREIFRRFFPEPWQVVLVVRPGLIGALRAATIGRSGKDPEVVLNAFNIRQLRAAAAHAHGGGGFWPSAGGVTPVKVISSEPATAAPVLASSAALEPLPRPVEAALAPVPGELQPRTQAEAAPRRAKTQALQQVLAIVGVLGAAAAGFLYLRAHGSDPIGLQAYQKDGVLRIEWNVGSRSVARATTAKLEIADGETATVRDLNKTDLNRGLWAVLCKRSDCTARLYLYDGSGYVGEEMARYAGRGSAQEPAAQAPAAAGDPGDAETVRRLERDKVRLREALDRERERANELDTRVKTLQKIINRGAK
ncbi:MAG: hypothetical protein JSU00_14865 [Acidobacteria bacterium]|nr:hypothetical protein [Acidobacteriota bacterium]